MDIGKSIRHYREMNGYTQKELADIIHVSERTIGHYETGLRSPSIDILESLAEALEIEIGDFLKPVLLKSDQLKELFHNDNIPDYDKVEMLESLIFEMSDEFNKKKKEKEPIKKNLNMDVRKFKAFIRKNYTISEEDLDEDITKTYTPEFIETNEAISIKDMDVVYNKQLAKTLIGLAEDENTYFERIYKEYGVWEISGKYRRKLFTIYIEEKTKKEYSFEVHIFSRPRSWKGETFEGANTIKEILDVVYPWFLETLKPEKIHLNPLALTYFPESKKEDLLNQKWIEFHTFSPRVHNGLIKYKIHTINDIARLSEKEIESIPVFGAKSAYEVIGFQKEMKEILHLLK